MAFKIIWSDTAGEDLKAIVFFIGLDIRQGRAKEQTMAKKEVRDVPCESMSCWSDTTDLVYLGCVSEVPCQFMDKSRSNHRLPADFYEKRVCPDFTLVHDATLPIQKVEALIPGEDKVVILWRVPYRRIMNERT